MKKKETWKKKFIWFEVAGRIGGAICVQTGRKKAPSYANFRMFQDEAREEGPRVFDKRFGDESTRRDGSLQKRLVKVTRHPRDTVVEKNCLALFLARRRACNSQWFVSTRRKAALREIRDVKSMGTSRASVLKQTFSLLESEHRVYEFAFLFGSHALKRRFPRARRCHFRSIARESRQRSVKTEAGRNTQIVVYCRDFRQTFAHWHQSFLHMKKEDNYFFLFFDRRQYVWPLDYPKERSTGLEIFISNNVWIKENSSS